MVVSRLAKCHGYDGYIRVKIFAGWGTKSVRTRNLAKLSLFWEDLHNLYKISVYKLAKFDKVLNICFPKQSFLLVLINDQCSRVLLRAKELTFRNSELLLAASALSFYCPNLYRSL